MTDSRCILKGIIACCTDMEDMLMMNEFREGVIQDDDGSLDIWWKDGDCMPLRYCPSCGRKIERKVNHE